MAFRLMLLCASSLVLTVTACSRAPWVSSPAEDVPSVVGAAGTPSGASSATGQPASPPAQARDAQAPVFGDAIIDTARPDTPRPRPTIVPGTGSVVKVDRQRQAEAPAGKGDYTLNFEATSIQEVVKVVLGDLLAVNYLIDPGVSGTVTMQTSQPLTREQLLPMLETLLEVNGAALVKKGAGFHVMPIGGAALDGVSAQARRASSAPGYRTQVVPLRFISAQEVERLLQPFLSQDVVFRSLPSRNLVVLSGSAGVISGLLDTIETFDVDWMRGMSVGLFPLVRADSKAVVTELEAIFGKSADNPLDSVLRMTSIERLNAVLAVTPQVSYLERVRDWVERLDRADDKASQRVYVYRVQNGKAADLAAVLGGIFGGGIGTDSNAPRAAVEPGSTPVELKSEAPIPPTALPAAGADRTQPSVSVTQAGGVRIIADEVNNALVIMSTPMQYEMVKSALQSLDVTPMQVLIEASIIEVRLSDELSYGVEWFFKNRAGDFNGVGRLDLGSAGLASLAPGFSYALIDSASQVRAVLNALAKQSKLNVLSSPSLMVLDNQTAKINVGDQVPIPIRQSTSNVNPDAPTVNEIQYRDTGVLLTVTPRVNASGLVTMEISQEVSDADLTSTSGLDAPTIRQRAIASTVAVQSGDTVVLGGLIKNNQNQGESGVPGLYRLPVIGKLFGTTSESAERTELLVLITPRAVRSRSESLEATRELREKLRGLQPYTR